jgi:hypothetical protein
LAQLPQRKATKGNTGTANNITGNRNIEADDVRERKQHGVERRRGTQYTLANVIHKTVTARYILGVTICDKRIVKAALAKKPYENDRNTNAP